MEYILAFSYPRRNARQHIISRGLDIENLRKMVDGLPGGRHYEIYNSKWELIEDYTSKGWRPIENNT